MRLDFEAYIIDLDGCMYRGDKLVSGADEVITKLRSRQKKVLFLTNNSTGTSSGYAKKLQAMGVEASPKDVLTSSTALAMYMRRLERGGVFVVGEKALRDAIADEGFEILDEEGAKKAKYVVSGLDRGLTYDKVSAACSAISMGAKYYATNADPTLPAEQGLLPGAGAIISMIYRTTKKRPLVVGKPSKAIIRLALGILGTDTVSTAIVGDAIEIDIMAGKKAELFSILTLTGVTKEEELKDHKLKPDLVLNSIKDLSGYI